jgi:hypothetical protein
MVGGILSAVLTIGLLPYFEMAFGILSPMRLIVVIPIEKDTGKNGKKHGANKRQFDVEEQCD